MSTREFLRHVSSPALNLENLQLTISIQADKGVLGPSSVVRIRLRMPSQKNPETPHVDEPPAAPRVDEQVDAPQVDERVDMSQLAPVDEVVDELFEFPTERQTEEETTAATPGVALPDAAQPRSDAATANATLRLGTHRLVRLVRLSTLVTFACGVIVGVLSVTPGTMMPMALRVPTHADRFSRIEPIPAVATIGPERANTAPALRPAAAAASIQPADSAYRSSLLIESTPDGAGVYLNNQPAGTTPLNLNGIPVGSRVVRLELPGYERWSSAITITSNEAARITAELHPVATSEPAVPPDSDQTAPRQ